MATLKIQGISVPRPERPALARGLPAGMVTTKAAVRVQTARADSPVLHLENLQPDDIVEIELNDGLHLWSRVDDLEHDYGLTRERAADDALTIPPTLPIGGPSRGWGEWVVKGLQVVGVDVAEPIGEFVAKRVESRLEPGPGVYRATDTSPAAPDRLTRLGTAGPTLIFIHGAASSTAGSFGGLWTGEDRSPARELIRQYDGRVLAFEHESLTKSPIENALALVTRLAELVDRGAELHLVSHGRGGLVGELLACGMRTGGPPFAEEDLALFASDDRARDRAALVALNRKLQRCRFRITRFARVACPARGTTLADGRLDRYFSVLVNVAALVPGVSGNPVYEVLSSLLAGVLKQRTEPKALPGLESMMPTSPLILMLNRPGAATGADLHVIGGDLAGGGLFGRLKTLASDLYYRDDHDLVVNTPAMLGGLERTGPVRYWIDTGPEVTHFHYFSRPDTVRRLVTALAGDAADFHTLTAKPSAIAAGDYRKRASEGERPIVFVIPGIMGSELSVGDRVVWLSLLSLATRGLSKLSIDAVGVRPTGVVYSAYARLCEYLSASHEVRPFPYDWRKPLEQSASDLRTAIEEAVRLAKPHGQPIRLLAHSMGGLVVRTMFGTRGGQDDLGASLRTPGIPIRHAGDTQWRLALDPGDAHRTRRAREKAGARRCRDTTTAVC